MKKKVSSREVGFTVIELVVAIALVTVFAAVVSMHWQSAGENTVSTQADLFAGNLRHAQNLATSRGGTLRLNVYSDRYCITIPFDTDCAKAIMDPATSQPFSVVLADAVTLSGSSTDYDNFGRPKDAGKLLSLPRIFKLKADTTTWLVTLMPITGFVTVAKL